MRRKTAFGVFCLTTVYPTTATGAHGNSGGKSAGKDVFPSGKGRKCPEISGNRYSQILWEQDAASSSLVTSTKKRECPFGYSLFFIAAILQLVDARCRRMNETNPL